MLFNKDGNGSQELYELTGFYYASNHFGGIISELKAATITVKNIVGDNVIDAAKESYYKDCPDLTLVNTVRLPIACLAILNWSKLNIVSHEDSGRKVKIAEDEKVPFEWMIDRDERELREKYYRALDSLLSYINEDKDKWGTTLFESESIISGIHELEQVYPIEGSLYSFHLFLPLFVEVQRTKLSKIINPASLSDLGHDSAIHYHARRYVILEALGIAVRRWSLTVFPLMVARRFAPSYQGNNEASRVTLRETTAFLQDLKSDIAEAEHELKELCAETNNTWNKVVLIPQNDPRKKFFTC